MIQAYNKKDKLKVLELIRLNTPFYFAAEEEEQFREYLEVKLEDYFVYKLKTKIIACGGINYGFDNGTAVRIAWDMVHPDHQGKGVGSELLKFRIDTIKQNPDIKRIIVRTAENTHKYYLKQGFKLISIGKDYWADGFDLYEMDMHI
jgi:[ribosomal protein S18]-alanine N-acetyltransferase